VSGEKEVPKYFLPTVSIHFDPPKENSLITKDKRGCLKVPITLRGMLYQKGKLGK
jgi:hypothetical protein